jgi:CheY-like chemotaxis protein
VNASPGRVLLVELDARSLREAWELLQGAGYDVVGCTSAADAILAILRGEEYDVILCDVGVEVATATGFRDQVAAIDPALAERLVWLTTNPRSPEPLRPVLVKPLEIEAVLACIDEYVVHRTIAPVTGR